jgi:hypothetical protein
VVHVSHVVRPVADAAIVLILQQHSSAAATRQREEEEVLQGVFKRRRLRRSGHQLERDAANSSAQTVTEKEAQPQKRSPCVRAMTFGMQAQPPSPRGHIICRVQVLRDTGENATPAGLSAAPALHLACLRKACT